MNRPRLFRVAFALTALIGFSLLLHALVDLIAPELSLRWWGAIGGFTGTLALMFFLRIARKIWPDPKKG